MSAGRNYLPQNVRHQAIAFNTTVQGIAVPGVPGRRIRVLAYSLMSGHPTTIVWKSGEVPEQGYLSGPMAFAANGGFSAPEAILGHMVTEPGEHLILQCEGDQVQVGGHLTFVYV